MTDQLENLRQYNIWRRGEIDIMPHPKDIGETIDWAVAEIERLRAAIVQTLNENGHLADGYNCTLIALKHAVPEWELPA